MPCGGDACCSGHVLHNLYNIDFGHMFRPSENANFRTNLANSRRSFRLSEQRDCSTVVSPKEACADSGIPLALC
jgi:hypothetical protein